MSTTTDRQSEHDDDRDTRAVELLRDLVSIGPANALGLRRRRPMADTAIAHGSADGQGASEERQRIDMIRHAHEVRVLSRLTIDERLQELGQRPKGVPPYELHFDVLLALADEAFALRAEVAAQRPVVEAVERYEAVWQQVLDSVADGVLLLPPDHHNTRIQARQALFDALARATPDAAQSGLPARGTPAWDAEYQAACDSRSWDMCEMLQDQPWATPDGHDKCGRSHE